MSATMTISAEAHSARYGPMESVLLFHNLVEAGAVSVESLQAAAAILMNNPLVDASRDRERFEPDALRQHVFHVIDDDSAASVDPALLHRATVKLYERYRKAVVASIREDEEQYFQKQEEIAEIKNGLCDERLLREYREGTMTSSRNASERGDTSPEKREHSSAQGTASPPPQADVVTPPTALIAAAAEPTATDETPRSSPTTPVSVAAPKEGKSVESARVTDLPLVGPRRPKTPQTPAVPATKPSPSVKAPPRLPVPPSPPTVTLPAAVSPPTAVALQTTKTRLSALAQVASVLPLLTEVSVGPSRQQSNELSAQKKPDPAKRHIHKPGPIAPALPTLAAFHTKTRKPSLPQLSKPPIRGTSKARQKQQEELERQRQQEEEERRRQEGDEERRRPQAPLPPFPYSRTASTTPSPATKVRQRQEAAILPQPPQPQPTPARRPQRAQVGTPPRLGSRQPQPVPAPNPGAPSGQPTATQSRAGPSRSVASGSTPIGPPGQPAVYPLAPPAPGTLARLMKTGARHHSPQGVEKRTSPPQAGESPTHPPQMLPPLSPPAYNPHQTPAHPGGPASAARQPAFVPGPPLTPQQGALPQPMPLPHLSPMPGYGIMYGSPQNSPGGTSQLHVQQHLHGLSPPLHGSPQYPPYAYTATSQQHQMGSHQQQPMSLPPMQQMQMHPPLATSPALRNVHPQPVSAALSPPAVFMSVDPGSPVQPGLEDISPISTPPNSPSLNATVVAPALRLPASAHAGTPKPLVAIAAKPDANKTTAGTTSKGKGPIGRPRKRPLDGSDAAVSGAQGQFARASAAKKDGTLMTPTPAKRPKLKDMLGSAADVIYPTPPPKTGRGGARGGRSTRGTGRGRPRGNRAAAAGRTTGLDVQDKDKSDQKQKDTVPETPISTKSSEPSKPATVLKSAVPTPPVKKGPNTASANAVPAVATPASTPKRGLTVTPPTPKEIPVEPATRKTNGVAGGDTETSKAPEKSGVPEKPAECSVASPSTPAAQRSRKRKAVSPPQGADDTEDELDANSKPPPSVSRPPQPGVLTTPLTLTMTVGHQPMITAYRRFSGLATPLIGNIFSHKFANLFSAPVPESRAPGYKSLIYRPQDLKSIKAAVKAGAVALQSLSTTSAVATPTTTETPPLYPTTSTMLTATTVTTPATTAVTPPRGIVNSQQLEKELFRMFANAVMYNKISTEIVKETVEMAKTVQAMVDDFRGAEEVGAKKRLLATKAVEEREREGSESVGGSVLGEGDDTGERTRKTPVSRRKVAKKKKGGLSTAAAMALAKKGGDQAQE